MDMFYSELHCKLPGVRSSGRHAIVGDDCNTQMHAGWRSDVMQAFVAEHGLEMLPDKPELPRSRRWTFESSLGHQQQLN